MRTYDWSKPEDRYRALVTRHAMLKSERSSWYAHWRDLAEHILPQSGRFEVSDRNRSNRSDRARIYDNTGTRAARILAAGMQAGASNPGRPWFKLTTADPDLADFHPVRLWLDDVVDRMQRVFARANTYRALHQCYEQLAVYGTAVNVLLPDAKSVIHHYPVVTGEYCLQRDYRGDIVSLYREFQSTVSSVVREFGYENCSQETREQFDAGHLENSVDVLHVIEPRDDRHPAAGKRDIENPSPRHMPWASLYLELSSSEEDRFLRESGFEDFPVLAPRWIVEGQDTYGQSPGMEALGDIRQLQHEQLRKGQAIDYKVRPPLQVPNELKDRKGVMFPGGVSYAMPGTALPYSQSTPHGGVRSMFEVNLDLNDLREDIIDVRGRINASFYADLFLALVRNDKTLTATEVAEIHEEKLLGLGPVLERLHNELLQPLIERTFAVMMREGMIPPPPSEMAGQDIDVEFVSILAQAQRAIGSNSIDRFLGTALQVAQVKPDVMDTVNVDAAMSHYGRILGVPTELLNDEDSVEAIRQARAQAQAAREAVELQNTQAQTAQTLQSVTPQQPVEQGVF